MSQAAPYTGRPVSEGTAAGLLHQADPGPPADATAGQVRAAFAAVAADRHDLAERLRVAGRAAEADIIGVAALIAADPALVGPAVTAVAAGTDAATAVAGAAEAQAAVLSGLAVPELAERAGDVRQIAQAVLGRLAAAGAPPRPDGAFILVRREVSPADLIEYAEDGLAGAVSVAGGGSSHAAIVARGLGLPMITGVDAAVLAEPDGQHAVLDAVAGELRIGPAAGAGLVAGGSAVAEGSAVAGGSAIAGGSVTGADGTAAGAGDQDRAGPRRYRSRPAPHRDPVHRSAGLADAGRAPGAPGADPRPAGRPDGHGPAARLLRRQDPPVPGRASRCRYGGYHRYRPGARFLGRCRSGCDGRLRCGARFRRGCWSGCGAGFRGGCWSGCGGRFRGRCWSRCGSRFRG